MRLNPLQLEILKLFKNYKGKRELLDLRQVLIEYLSKKEETNGNNYDAEKITRLLYQIRKKKIFQKIDNPSKWQKKIRDEWR